jgi:hypothetical protein
MKTSAAQGIVGVNAEMLADVEISLKNLEYTIEQYLLTNGARLDAQTRLLLAGVRDCVGRVAGSTRHETDPTSHAI